MALECGLCDLSKSMQSSEVWSPYAPQAECSSLPPSPGGWGGVGVMPC